MSTRFGYLPVASALHDPDGLHGFLGDYFALLDELGGKRRSADTLLDPAPLVWLVGTGGTERKILQYWEQRHRANEYEPVVLLAHHGHNSLAAALETLARLQQDGAAGRVVYVEGPRDGHGREQVRQAVQDLLVNQALRSARIGLLGTPSDWLVASSPEPRAVRNTWGPAVHTIPLDILREGVARLRNQPVDDIVHALVSKAAGVDE
ncbi:MAG: hypothetical protein MUF54_14285, partial [Polyangiaceae bacterium]|nr:hypothetical protein [Polyangiaceae bacterium]